MLEKNGGDLSGPATGINDSADALRIEAFHGLGSRTNVTVLYAPIGIIGH
jgi:hypothetical protein